MAEDKVERILIQQTQSPEISPFGKNIPELDVIVLKCSFLVGTHGITVEDPGAPGSV